MVSELARVTAGMPVAVLLPLSIPGIRGSRPASAALASGYAGLVLSPLYPEWQAFVLLVLAALSGWLAAGRRSEPFNWRTVAVVVVVAAGVTVVAALIDVEATWHAVR